tara:strand:- start:1508 stop:2152 length:645 start_codon:yes stop_codon:yes gene_type:complete
MKVKIKKKGKTKQFKLISKWSDVTLEKWVKLIDYNNGTKSTEALNVIAELSNIPKKLIKELELKDVSVILSAIARLQKKQNSSLKKIIEIEGKKYGFHPNLEEITLGEWSDLETMFTNGMESNLPEIMSILYRPITDETLNEIYTIAAYDGNISIRAEQMKKMSAEQVQSALVFFWTLGKEFTKTLPLYLMDRIKEMKLQLQQNHLQKNGGTSE